MIKETIEILRRACIEYDEKRPGARDYVVEQVKDLEAAQVCGGHVEHGPYWLRYEKEGEVVSPRPVKPHDIMLCPRMRDMAEKLRAFVFDGKDQERVLAHRLDAANLLDEAREALANASGEKCDIAEYHTRQIFKLRHCIELFKRAAGPEITETVQKQWEEEQKNEPVD